MRKSQAPKARQWARRLGVLLVVAGLGYFLATLSQQLQSLPPVQVDGLALVALGFGVAVPPLTVALIGLLWRALLADQGVRVGRGAAIRIIAVSQIGKYLPGNIGHFVGRGALAHAAGIPVGATLSTTMLEIIWTLSLGAGLSALTLLWWLDASTIAVLGGVDPRLMLVLGAVLAIGPWPGIRLINRFLPSFSTKLGDGQPLAMPRLSTVFSIVLILLVCFGLLGVSVWLQARGLFGVESGSVAGFTLLFVTAWVAGYIIPGAPGGLGVREAVILGLFSPMIGAGPALALGISTRVVTTIGDGIAFFLGMLGAHRHRVLAGFKRQKALQYGGWLKGRQRADARSSRKAQGRLERAGYQPIFTLLVPDAGRRANDLAAMIESVTRQVYGEWHVLLVDSADGGAVSSALEQWRISDPRIEVVPQAPTECPGDWLVTLDPSTRLTADALLWIAEAALTHSGWTLIYTDEGRLDSDGHPAKPVLKPDWSPHLALCDGYPGSLLAIHHTIIANQSRHGGCRTIALSAAAEVDDKAIGHIPRVLCHCPDADAIPGSKDQSDPQAIEDYITRRYPGVSLSLAPGRDSESFQLRFNAEVCRKASIIIPTRDQRCYLQPCIESILSRTEGINYEVIVLDNGSTDPDALEYLAALKARSDPVTVIDAEMPFNWSRLNNLGAAQAEGDVLVFLNNDTEVLSPDWLLMLAGYAGLPDVGVAGGLLFYPDGTLQHAGVVVGMNGWADHVFIGEQAEQPGKDNPFVSPMQTRNVLAVTGACLAVSRSVFDAVGGFDESFMICGSDIAFCLAARDAAGFNVLVAEAQLTHYESKTRTPEVPEVDFVESNRAYAPYRVEAIDPFFNPNLSLARTWPTLNRGKPRPAAGDAQATSIG